MTLAELNEELAALEAAATRQEGAEAELAGARAALAAAQAREAAALRLARAALLARVGYLDGGAVRAFRKLVRRDDETLTALKAAEVDADAAHEEARAAVLAPERRAEVAAAAVGQASSAVTRAQVAELLGEKERRLSELAHPATLRLAALDAELVRQRDAAGELAELAGLAEEADVALVGMLEELGAADRSNTFDAFLDNPVSDWNRSGAMRAAQELGAKAERRLAQLRERGLALPPRGLPVETSWSTLQLWGIVDGLLSDLFAAGQIDRAAAGAEDARAELARLREDLAARADAAAAAHKRSTARRAATLRDAA